MKTPQQLRILPSWFVGWKPHGVNELVSGRQKFLKGRPVNVAPIIEGLTRRAAVIDSPESIQGGRPNAAVEDLNGP